jgi:sterol desaturase/sphingolipid hydroxylase (fatty acid hydroxylase superfamily)
VELLLAVMLLDLIAQWLAHYMLHKIKWMWKLHLVHHSDTNVDATTGTRHHPGDYAVREIFSLFTVLIFGIPLAYYIFYRIATIFFTYFTHANITLPRWLDKTTQPGCLSPLICTSFTITSSVHGQTLILAISFPSGIACSVPWSTTILEKYAMD